jgi:hypothetical protein
MVSRRSVLKLFGIGAGAAAAPWAVELPSSGPPPVECAKRDPSEFGLLLITTDRQPIWGPGVEQITHEKEGEIDVLRIEFRPWQPYQTKTLLGCHLIHKPTRKKFEYKEFASSTQLVPGDLVHVTYRTLADLRGRV